MTGVVAPASVVTPLVRALVAAVLATALVVGVIAFTASSVDAPVESSPASDEREMVKFAYVMNHHGEFNWPRQVRVVPLP